MELTKFTFFKTEVPVKIKMFEDLYVKALMLSKQKNKVNQITVEPLIAAIFGHQA